MDKRDNKNRTILSHKTKYNNFVQRHTTSFNQWQLYEAQSHAQYITCTVVAAAIAAENTEEGKAKYNRRVGWNKVR